MISNSIYIISEYDIILLNMKYLIKYTIPFRLVLILFAKKSNKELYFYINYRKLNAIIKRN